MTHGGDINVHAGGDVASRKGVSYEAYALRRYVRNRKAGRTMPEYERYDATQGVWLASDRVAAAGRIDGRAFRQVRREGLPWCEWLGQDTVIAEDHALQAFFELHTAERRDWNLLYKEVDKNRQKALRDWRRLGYEAIARIRWEQAREAARAAGEEAEETHLPTPLADKYRMFLPGMRSLKNA